MAKGQVYLCPGVTRVVADHFKATGDAAGPSVFSALTDKERTVLQLLAEGRQARDISRWRKLPRNVSFT